MNNLATIKPAESAPGQPTTTRGTQVVLSDGTVLGGVQRIELVAEMNDLWRARIDCMVNVQLMPGMTLDIRQPGRTIVWWRRWLLRLAGVSAIDVTTLDERHGERWTVLKRLQDRSVAGDGVDAPADDADETDRAPVAPLED
jgi:hypothetical protein